MKRIIQIMDLVVVYAFAVLIICQNVFDFSDDVRLLISILYCGYITIRIIAEIVVRKKKAKTQNHK